MKAKITKRAVDAAAPGKRDAFLWDTALTGFGLKVTPAGNRIYILQYRFGRRLRRYTIGKHGSPWTPEEARREAARLLGLVATGTDPADVKAETRRELTITELCDLYLAEGCVTKRPSTLVTDRRNIERHIKPLLGRKGVRAVTGADIERFQRDIQSGENRAAQVLAFLRNRIESGGGSKIDDDQRPAVFFKTGDGVDDAVGTHFGGIVIQNGNAGLDAGAHHQGIAFKVFSGQFLEHRDQRRHHAGDDDMMNAGRADLVEP